MSAGALVVGSDTQPVREVIAPGRNGLLGDFFDRQALPHAVADVLAHPKKYLALREHARATVVGRYDLKSVCLPRQLQMVDAVAQGRAPTQF
jgi:glycosyltransferase involved in cell wall biosynthesis